MSTEGKISSLRKLIGKIKAPNTIHGKSAYEIAVMHGFDGTEEEWLLSLKDGAVHDWAKQPEKPKYTAEEVGALSSEICSDRYAINIEPNITRYHLSASAMSIINCQDMALIPDGYKAEIIIDNPYGEPTLPFFSDVLKDTSDDGKALTGLNGFVARDGAVLTIYKVRDADKFNWYLSKHGLPISGVAQIGQTIVVKAVDDAMRPTEWECANLPTGGGSEWRKIADITLEEDVTMFSISTDMNGNPLDISEIWVYFDVYQYNEELESGKTRDENMWMVINGEKLPFEYSSVRVRCGSQDTPYHQMYYSGYNSKNGQMIMSTTIMSTLGECLPSIRNAGFTIDEKIHQLGYQMPYPNRKWGTGSKIVIYGR